MSFAGEERNNGIVIAEGETFEDAFAEVCRRGLNPGGELMALPVPPEGEAEVAGMPMWTIIDESGMRERGYRKTGELVDDGLLPEDWDERL